MSVFNFVTSRSTVSTSTVTFTSSSTSGDIILAVNATFDGVLATSVHDSVGNTYTALGTNNVLSRGHLCVFVATNIGTGTNTITFAGASGANTDYIAAEYNTPPGYFITNLAGSNGPLVGGTTWNFVNPITAVGSDTITEMLMVPIAYNTQAFGTWTLSTGTIREFTSEPDSATVMLGDWDIVGPTGTETLTITSTQGGNIPLFPIVLSAVSAGSAGGRFVRVGWGGGF